MSSTDREVEEWLEGFENRVKTHVRLGVRLVKYSPDQIYQQEQAPAGPVYDLYRLTTAQHSNRILHHLSHYLHISCHRRGESLYYRGSSRNFYQDIGRHLDFYTMDVMSRGGEFWPGFFRHSAIFQPPACVSLVRALAILPQSLLSPHPRKTLIEFLDLFESDQHLQGLFPGVNAGEMRRFHELILDREAAELALKKS